MKEKNGNSTIFAMDLPSKSQYFWKTRAATLTSILNRHWTWLLLVIFQSPLHSTEEHPSLRKNIHSCHCKHWWPVIFPWAILELEKKTQTLQLHNCNLLCWRSPKHRASSRLHFHFTLLMPLQKRGSPLGQKNLWTKKEPNQRTPKATITLPSVWNVCWATALCPSTVPSTAVAPGHSRPEPETAQKCCQGITEPQSWLHHSLAQFDSSQHHCQAN